MTERKRTREKTRRKKSEERGLEKRTELKGRGLKKEDRRKLLDDCIQLNEEIGLL